MEEDIQRVGNFFSAWREKGVSGCWRDYSVRGKKRSLWFFGEIFSPGFGQIFQSVGFERYGGRVSEKIQTVLGRGSNRVSLKKDSVWQEKRRGCVVERERKHDQIFYFLGIVKVPLWIRTASLKGEFWNRLHSTDFVLFIGTLKLRLEIREIVLKVWWFLISRLLCVFLFMLFNESFHLWKFGSFVGFRSFCFHSCYCFKSFYLWKFDSS